MASEVSICNSALIKLGAEPITSLLDTSKQAVLCNAVYEQLRDALLGMHLWNFAMAVYTCPEITGGGDWEYEHAYQLPTDVLRVVKVNTEDDWIRKENKIMTDYTEDAGLEIKYVKKQTDPNKFSASFREALALYIASEIGFSITQSTTQTTQIQERFVKYLKESKSNDSQEGTPTAVFSDFFLDSRN